MLLSLLECIVCLLAAYGLLALVLEAVEFLHCRNRGKRPEVQMILLVRNAEEQIEYIVRNIVNKDYITKVLSDKKLMIVDMNSTDQTIQLLEKLQNNFSNIEMLPFKEKERVFEDFTIFSPTGK